MSFTFKLFSIKVTYDVYSQISPFREQLIMFATIETCINHYETLKM